MMHELTCPADLEDLATLSAAVGADPLLIQAAGGNISVKDGATLWIKASGTLLADALKKDIFVPVDLPAMRRALAEDSLGADQTLRFALASDGLRPSIETSLHAVFRQRVVVHVHCVNTLAHAVRRDAESLLAGKLEPFDWRFVPYCKPGAKLANQVADTLGPQTSVVVMGNHGLIVAGDSIAETEDLLGRVCTALHLAPAAAQRADIDGLSAMAGDAWEVPAASCSLHQLALTPGRVAQATGGSLYPDHVIFCGVGAKAADGASLPRGVERPPFVIVPGKGVLVTPDASVGARALATCLADVLLRVPDTAELVYLSAAENAELVDWDAEKYRKALNAG
jgi:rhamnose utilization protein RhaD (predicted bifunctional aldolase and dehydrogenase)